ncbi:MAG: hypothetical protein R3F20_05010 [Planctomycetota bacterium]
MRTIFLLAVLALSLGPCLLAQSVAFSGDVAADFAADRYLADPTDLAMPPALAGAVSGFELHGVAMSYDHATDTLFVGLDCAGIAGDADGDGDPSFSSSSLVALGGLDQPDFAGGESFAVAFDLDDDGTFDVIAGLPMGGDLSSFTVAQYDASASAGDPSDSLADLCSRFGAPIPGASGLIHATPSVAAPDLEFAIVGVSHLMATFGLGNASGQIGVSVCIGSLDDQVIGNDGVTAEWAVIVIGPCFPMPNLYEMAGFEFVPGGFNVALRYHVLAGYGCCTLYSLLLAPTPIVLTGVNGQPQILVGDYAAPGSLFAIDLGVPDLGGLGVDCKTSMAFIPASLPSGLEIHAQTLAYPSADPTAPFMTSNVITWTQP